MSRIRSPNYPMLSLPEAIEKVTAIYKAEQHLAAPKEVVAQALGYASLHALAGRVISAIEKYGLLEEASGDKVKVSALAMSILHPATPEEKQKAINEAAYKPSLFTTIKEEWGGERPSDTNLRVYLIRNKFSQDALDRVIQIYKETMDLVTPESGAYPGNDGEPKFPEHQEKPGMQPAIQQPSGRGAPLPGGPMSVSFTGDRLQVSAVLEDGEAVDKLIKALTATKALLPEKKKSRHSSKRLSGFSLVCPSSVVASRMMATPRAMGSSGSLRGSLVDLGGAGLLLGLSGL